MRTLKFVLPAMALAVAMTANWKDTQAAAYANPVYSVLGAETTITAKVGGCPAYVENTKTDIVFFDDETYVANRQNGDALTGKWTEIKTKSGSVIYMEFNEASKEDAVADYDSVFSSCGSDLVSPSVLTKQSSAKVVDKTSRFVGTTKMTGKDIDSSGKAGGFKSKIKVTGTIEKF